MERHDFNTQQDSKWKDKKISFVPDREQSFFQHQRLGYDTYI